MGSEVRTASGVQRVPKREGTGCDHLRDDAKTLTGGNSITLNVGGVKFLCDRELLRQCSHGRLSKVGRQDLEIGPTSYSEYFFDRDPRFFPTILDFYRCGRLQMNTNFCLEQWMDELEFWELSSLCEPEIR